MLNERSQRDVDRGLPICQTLGSIDQSTRHIGCLESA
jgi:hypothetical protein